MSRPPAFPPDVARALQQPAGRASVRYTVGERVARRPPHDTPLMETPYDTVLAALTLDTKGRLRFVRTGSAAEGARVAMTDVSGLIAPGAHWDITLSWDAGHIDVAVRDVSR